MENNMHKVTALKIGLLGNGTVGKTAIINSIFGFEHPLDTMATISDKEETKFKLKNNENIKLIFYDVSGNERFRSSGLKYMKAVQGIILIFDFTRKKSFDDLNVWLELINDNLDNPFIVLFGNKIDTEKDNWEVTSEESKNFAKKIEIAFFETSAKTGQGINEGLSYIANSIYDKILNKGDQNIIIDNNNDKIKSNKNSNCPGNKKRKNNK